jgi:hypothetical protein
MGRYGLMMLCIFCAPLLCGAGENIVTEELPFEGHWKNEASADCGTMYQSIAIERRGSVYEGGAGVGCGRGRIWFSILTGEKKGDRLYARICFEPDADDEDNNEYIKKRLEKEKEDFKKCMEESPKNYFVRKDKSLVWFVKKNGGWKEYLVLERAKLAKKAPKNSQFPEDD